MGELSSPIRDIFGADGKCQASVAYDDLDNPLYVTTIIVSQQTKPNLDKKFYTDYIIEECIKKVIPHDI